MRSESGLHMPPQEKQQQQQQQQQQVAPDQFRVLQRTSKSKKKTPGPNVLIMALPNRPRAERATAPKTRTGCKQCKRRHVKCDEAKPSCKRCVASGRQCDILLGQVKSGPLTRTNATTTTTAVVRSPDYRVLAAPNHILTMFKAQDEFESFSIFTFTLGKNTTIPMNPLAALTCQIAQDEACVREICCAIGAANNAFNNPFTTPEQEQMGYRLALLHYNRAIRAVTQTTEPSSDAMLRIALASLLFVTFDMLRGDLQVAYSHFNHGRRLIESHFEKKMQETGLPVSELQCSTLELALFDTMQRLTTHPWALGLGINGSRMAENRMQGCSLGRKHKYLVQEMPSRFDDVNQAVTWWDVTNHVLVHHTEQDTPEHRFALLHQWHNSFWPTFQSARNAKDEHPHKYLKACVTESMYLETLTRLHVQQDRVSNVMPDVKPIYRDIVDTTKQAWNRCQTFEEIMKVDHDLLLPIVFVLFKSQDPDVREHIRATLEEVSVRSIAARPVLSMLSTMPVVQARHKLKNIERSLGWCLTVSGCGMGAIGGL